VQGSFDLRSVASLLRASLRMTTGEADPSLRSGFRLRAPAPLTPAKRLNFAEGDTKLKDGAVRGRSRRAALDRQVRASFDKLRTGSALREQDPRERSADGIFPHWLRNLYRNNR
jgi:hypothetical protein